MLADGGLGLFGGGSFFDEEAGYRASFSYPTFWFLIHNDLLFLHIRLLAHLLTFSHPPNRLEALFPFGFGSVG